MMCLKCDAGDLVIVNITNVIKICNVENNDGLKVSSQKSWKSSSGIWRITILFQWEIIMLKMVWKGGILQGLIWNTFTVKVLLLMSNWASKGFRPKVQLNFVRVKRFVLFVSSGFVVTATCHLRHIQVCRPSWHVSLSPFLHMFLKLNINKENNWWPQETNKWA